MLTPDEMALLTAHVDGELTESQRRKLSRLLQHNPEAFATLRKLEADAALLRSMPTPRAPADFAANVLAALPERRPVRRRKAKPAVPIKPLRLHRPGRRMSWGFATAAAAALLVVGLAAFLKSPPPATPDDNGGLVGPVAKDDKTDNGDKGGAIVKAPPAVPDDDNEPDPLPPVAPRPPVVPDDGDDAPPTPNVKPIKPEVKPGTVLTAGGIGDGAKLERVELSLPVIHRVHELGTEANFAALAAGFRTAPAYRVEVPARDATRGFDRLRQALAAKKIPVVMDNVVTERLKKPRWRTDYAVFVENITPAELADILRDTGAGDKPEVRLEGALVVKELSRHDRKELTELLGVDPVAVRPTAVGAKAVDVTKPLTDDTAKLVGAALDGKGVARPGAAVPVQAMVQMLGGPKSRTAELRRFLEARTPARPGTVQLFLVIRNVGA